MAIGASPVNVQSFGNVLSPQTLSFTPTNGNYLVIYQLVGAGGSFMTSPTLTNVTWTHLGQYTVNRKIDTFIGAVSGGSGGTSLSWTSGAGLNAIVIEWSGLDGGWDNVNSAGANNGAGGTTSVTANVTPVASTNVLLLAGLSRAGTFSSGPSLNWTDVSVSSATMRVAYQVVNGASGSYQNTWTYSTSNTSDQYVLILTAPSGGGGRTLFYRPGLDGLSSAGPKQLNPSLG